MESEEGIRGDGTGIATSVEVSLLYIFTLHVVRKRI